MPDLAAVIRALHYASSMLPVGVFAFRLLLLPPQPRTAAQMQALRQRLDQSLSLLLAIALGLALLTGFLWLVLEAASMSGAAGLEAFRPTLLKTVLSQTQFGKVWLLRLALLVLLAICQFLRRRFAPAGRRQIDGVSALLAGTLVGALAWAGHAAAGEPAIRPIQLGADFVHLAAASMWLGCLLPLALILAAARRSGAWRPLAGLALLRFGNLGLFSVGLLLLTGLVNSWLLVGNSGGLFGTLYGRLLLLKLGCFAIMLGLAAENRLRFTPALALSPPDRFPPAALSKLGRNAALEFLFGLLLLLIVGQLGATAPAEHTQAVWPFRFRVSLDALEDENFPFALFRGLCTVAVFAGVVFGLFCWRTRSRRLWLGVAGGLFALALAGVTYLLTMPAYPTSYIQPAVRYEAASIARGAPLYAANCSLCHGPDGYGDGPAAASLAIRPANLTAGHLLHHAPGDLFWWVSHGIAGTPMPAFADQLNPTQRWDVLNFLRGRADADQAKALTPAVEPWRPLVAPDFTFELPGRGQDSLQAQRGRAVVLLVLYRLPAAEVRLNQLAVARPAWRQAGIRLLLAPVDPATRQASPPAGLPVIGNGAAAIAAAYSLFRPEPHQTAPVDDLEFLIDRQGYLRARWTPAVGVGWRDPAAIITQAVLLAREPARAPAPEGHVH